MNKENRNISDIPVNPAEQEEDNIINEQDLKEMFAFEPDENDPPQIENASVGEDTASAAEDPPPPKEEKPEAETPLPKEENSVTEQTSPKEEKPEPEKPSPKEEKTKPEKPSPKEEKTKPEKPSPKEEKTKPEKPSPKEEKTKPEKPSPKEEKTKPEKSSPKEKKPKFGRAARNESAPPPNPTDTYDRALALEALERDLAAAMQKKEEEREKEAENRRREEERQAEHLENVKKLHEDAARKKEREKAIEKKKEEEKEKKAKPSVVTPYKEDKDPAFGMTVVRAITTIIVVFAVAYAGGLLYARSLNDEYIKGMEKDLMGISVAGESYRSQKSRNYRDEVSYEGKEMYSLSEFLPDSDKDGLSDYYEMTVLGTDPQNNDSDHDGIIDGAEVYAGLDPLSFDDCTAIITVNIETEGASAEITGVPRNALATIDKVTNNSIAGAVGIVGTPYEFYTAAAMQSCRLTLSYTDEMLEKWGTDPNSISMFKFNSDTFKFEFLNSTINKENKTVTADINSIGIYAIGASEYLGKDYNSRIYFLIDNSGSMYPEELCPNSEENDINFKRLEFANGVIDILGDKAEYGAAQFTGTYNKLSSVTSDREAVKTQINSVRTSDVFFDGTDIAGSLSAAVDELGQGENDRSYIILLTDGYPTDSTPEKEREALQKAVDNNVTVFTVGLGKRIDSDYLSNISERTNGQYYQVSNAAALDRICAKIDSFMSYNKTTVTLENSEESTDVYIIADSGFNVDKDSMAYNNFRTDFSETGTDYGIAELTRQYFTGELKIKNYSYYTDNGDSVPGYDLKDIEQLADGKPDLVDLKLDFLDGYNKYLSIENKWDYHLSDGKLLKYNTRTRDFIAENKMSVSILPYTVKLPELDRWIEMLQKITFQRLPEFSSYECAVLNSVLHDGNDKAMLDVFRYMQNIHNSYQKSKLYDFGYDSSEAYDVLRTELSMGDPVVISAGGSALNAVRLLRESENSNKFILEAYDCNNLGVTTYISILRTPIYDGSKTPYYQYSATVYGKEVPLLMYVSKDRD